MENLETKNIINSQEKQKDQDHKEVQEPKPEIISVSPQECLNLAKQEGLVWDGVFNRIQNELQVAREISCLENFPQAEGNLEDQIGHMRTIVNMAFIKREAEDFAGRQFLDKLYDRNMSRQEFLSFLLKEDGLYFDSKGNNASLENYLKDYYQDKLGDFDISIGSRSINNFRYLTDNPDHRSAVNDLRKLDDSGKQMSVLVLEDKKSGKRKEIPLFCNKEYLEKQGSNAQYEYANYNDESIRERIVIGPVEKISPENSSVPETVSVIVHEIDHAVYNFLHNSEYREQQRRLKEIAVEREKLSETKNTTEEEFKAAQIKKKALAAEETEIYLGSFKKENNNRFGKTVISEGLARNAQQDFFKTQIRGLEKYSKHGKGFSEGASLLENNKKINDQVNFSMLPYGVGEIIIKLFSQKKTKSDIYKTDALEKEIIKKPQLINIFISHFAKNYNNLAEALNGVQDKKYKILDQNSIRSLVKQGMGGFAPFFVLGDRYWDMLEASDKEVEDADEKDVDARIREFLAMDKERAEYFIKNTDDNSGSIENKKKILMALNITMGKIKMEFDTEYNKLFEK
jgi:hypothetical protein